MVSHVGTRHTIDGPLGGVEGDWLAQFASSVEQTVHALSASVHEPLDVRCTRACTVALGCSCGLLAVFTCYCKLSTRSNVHPASKLRETATAMMEDVAEGEGMLVAHTRLQGLR